MTIAPVEPLEEGDYVLTFDAENNDYGQDLTETFTVVDSAEHAELSASINLTVEQNDGFPDCIEGPWAPRLELSNTDGMPAVAYLIHDFELVNGDRLTLAGGPEGVEGFEWEPGSKRIDYIVEMREEPTCVDVTAVLTTGRQVPLGNACDDQGRGCSSVGGSPAPLSLLLAFFAIAFRRGYNRWSRSRLLNARPEF